MNVINNESIRGSICSDLLRNGYDRPTGGKDVGDHPPMYVAFFLVTFHVECACVNCVNSVIQHSDKNCRRG